MNRAVIFGVGNEYKNNKEYYETNYNVVALMDNAYKSYDENVLCPEELRNIDYEVIIITPINNKEIIKQIIDMGVDNRKIIVYNSLQHINYYSGVNGIKYCSQHGEDLILTTIFNIIGILHPSYIDLGACSPNIHSNTQLLYESGSRGINVEANPNNIRSFEVIRPDDINLNIGVSDVSGIMPYYIMDNQGLNTFSKELALQNGQIKEVLDIPVKTLKDIIEEYCPDGFPDFLDCDIEGYDYKVLSSYNFRGNGPKVIMCEVGNDETELFDKLMKINGYFLYCRVVVNNIYVKETYKKDLGLD